MPRKHRLSLVATVCCLLLACGCALPSPVPDEDGGNAVSFSSGGQADAANQPVAQPSDSDAFLAVTDMAGQTVELDAYPARIAVLDEAACEILYAIGAGELIVARGAYCDYPQEVFSVAGVSMNEYTSAEQILPLEPQLVLLSPSSQIPEQMTALEQAGVKVAVIDAKDIAGVYTSINLIGALTNKSAEASKLISEMVTKFAALQAAASGGGKTVYFETGTTESGLKTLGGDSIVSALCVLIGTRNEFEDLTGQPEITYDQVVGRNPDFMIQTYQSTADETVSALDGLLAREGWDQLKAVTSGRVAYLSGALLTRPGPRLMEGAQALYDACFGELPTQEEAPEETPNP